MSSHSVRRLLFSQVGKGNAEVEMTETQTNMINLTFVLRLIDAKQGVSGPTHCEPGPDPKTNTQEDI